MAIQISEIIEILHDHNIYPDEQQEVQLPDIGEIEEGEMVYRTSIEEVFHEAEEHDIFESDDPRIDEWWGEIEDIIQTPQKESDLNEHPLSESQEPLEPRCAWYRPIHFYGYRWGIYIREGCILKRTKDIARLVKWADVQSPRHSIALQLWRSAFYVSFLHEQFHHKVESLGFRLLITTSSDLYRPYKANVYRKYYLTPACLEESLANAESYRRLGETRYSQRLEYPIFKGLRTYLRASIPGQPPGYAQGIRFFPDAAYRQGLYRLQSEILDGALNPSTPIEYWAVAPNMITALKDITDEIYMILPQGARPIFRPTSIAP